MEKSGIDLVFTRRFCMGHRLLAGNSQLCAVPHGHNEYVVVTLTGAPRADGARLDGAANMVAPFAQAKGRWHRFIDERVDHVLQLDCEDPLLAWFRKHEPERLERIMVTPGNPTTELVGALLLAKLRAFIAASNLPLQATALELRETPTNTVRISGDPADLIPMDVRGLGWWLRADDSIAG